MNIDLATGLPEVPEGYFWAVVWTYRNLHTNDSLLDGKKFVKALQVKLCKNEMVQKNHTSRHTQSTWKTLWFPVTVVDIETREEEVARCVASEDLIEFNLASVESYATYTAKGWNRVTNRNGQPSNPYTAYIYRVQEGTPENVLKAAEKVYKKYQEKKDELASKAEKDRVELSLLGVYPPKRLELS